MTIRRFPLLLLTFLIGFFVPRQASAASIQLTCILNTTPCTPSGQVYGTVTLDQVGADVRVTVDLANSQNKFSDLMLNYAGTAASITDNDPNNVLSLTPNGFSITPYTGLFDIGENDNKGVEGNDLYTVLLSAVGGLTLADFLVPDSSGAGGVIVALHIQNVGPNGCTGVTNPCDAGTTGNGSMKIGGFLPGEVTELENPPSVPEPSSLLLFGTGLVAAARKLRRRNA